MNLLKMINKIFRDWIADRRQRKYEEFYTTRRKY